MDFLRRIMTKKPPTPDKMVFISYRREVGGFIAHTIFTYLRANGYDAFMDVESLDSGAFDNMLLNQIATRNHFIVILAPGTVERCANEDDWVRREIEYAMQTGRNIIPVMVNNFSFEQVDVYLTGKLADLKRYNGVTLHLDYLDAGLERIRNRFLKGEPVPLQPVTINTAEMKVVEAKIEAIATEEAPSKEELKAEYFFGIGYGLQETGDLAGAIAQYTEAIRVNPNYRRAYYNRALAYQKQGDNDQAEADYRQVIRIDPTYPKGYNNLGVLLMDAGRDDEALVQLDMAVKNAPDDPVVYQNRVTLRQKMGDSLPTPFYNTTQDSPKPELYPVTNDLPQKQLSSQPRPLSRSSISHAGNIRGDIGMVTDAGHGEQTNQDACSYFCGIRITDGELRKIGCFIVADGFGTHKEGGRASRLAVQIIENRILSQIYLELKDKPPESILTAGVIIDAFHKADNAIINIVPDGSTTATVAMVIGDMAMIGHIGDSRAYWVSGNLIKQLTRDHTQVQKLIELDQISIKEAKNHPQKGILYRALGKSESVEVDIIKHQLTPNGKLVLCTDGLTDWVSDAEIRQIINYILPAPDAAQELVSLALKRGGADNITVIVV